MSTPSTYQLKSRFQSLLRPLAGTLHRVGVKANHVTVAACLMSVALGAWALLQPERTVVFLLIAFWCLLRMACNALDGMLAREFGQATRLGAWLNDIGDIVSDVMLYLPFAFVAGAHPWLVVAVVALAVASEAAGMLGGKRRYDGPMGKSDRALVFGVVALLAGLHVPLEAAINWIWAVMACLLLATIINRLNNRAPA
jgi:CDP-diacylglycerol---glycerol-3-phosphate 3-phosphatidyltransferase